ncbi:27363_t:CDS:2 [Gigaspora margarita]|uniref:27363_t:CDS:1 n=1 Tax=Gigaspora margarita TaxID=4874 RepID=A0ABN7V7L8_GIGMA|nr:27363_t:CDS:2 [Gigaspora margarita]
MSNNSSSCESDLENFIVLNINLNALKKSASSVFKVQCTSIQEFNKSGFYKVYILKMEDGKEYIGRVEFLVYLQWKTESEVAVIDSVNNLVEAEYILIEPLSGIRLCNI